MSTNIPKNTNIVQTPDVYVYALPSQSDTIDLAMMDSTENKIAAQLIDRLMTFGSFDFNISASRAAVEKLKNIFSNTTYRAAQLGCNHTAIGYPLAIFDNGQPFGKQMVLPIFLWYCDIVPNHIEMQASWRVFRQNDAVVEPNWHLIAMCRELYQVDLQPVFTQILQKKPIQWADLSDLCEMVSRLMLSTTNRPATGIEPCPTLSALQKGDAFAALSWSGVVGEFPFQQAEQSLHKIEDGTLSPENHHAYLPCLNDAYQQNAFQSLLQSGVTVVEGGSVTGKSYLTANAACNFLSNKKRTLIVAPTTAALHQITRFFKQLGLDDMTITAVNPQDTQQALFDKLCRITEKSDTIGLFNETHFRRQIFENQQDTNDKNKIFEKYFNKILGEQSHADLVAGYLQSNQQAKKSLLNTYLKPNDFERTWQEWQALQTAVQNAQAAFAHIGSLRHPLLRVTSFIFNEMTAEEGKSYLERQLVAFIATAHELHHQYLETIEGYVDTVTTHYTAKAKRLQEGIAAVQQQMQLGKHLYGEEFKKSNALPILHLFSDKQRSMRHLREEAHDRLRALRTKHEEDNLFFFKFSEDVPDVKAVSFEINAFERALQEWEQLVPKLVTQQLHTGTIVKASNDTLRASEELSSLSVDCTAFLKKINKSNLFKEIFKSENFNPTLKIVEIEKIIDILTEIQHNLRDFQAIRNWHVTRKNFNKQQLAVTEALVRVQPANWQDTISSWYFAQILVKDNIHIDKISHTWSAYHENNATFQTKILHQIYTFWTMRQKEIARQYLQKNRGEWIAIKNSRRNVVSPQDFAGVAINLTLLSDIFPIVLTTPDTLNHVLQEKSTAHFDLICFDDADALLANDAATAWNMGSRVLITGNSAFNQAPRRFTSLLSYAKYNYNHSFTLKTLHGFDENDRFVFCKNAFDWVATPPPAAATPPFSNTTKVIAVGGHFAANVNKDEIFEVLRKITVLENDDTQEIQSIAIVCFTKEQRNALHFELSERTTYQEQEKPKRKIAITALQISECAGQQFDVLMVSNTMGTVDIKGSLTNHTQLLNLPEYKMFLQQLLTRPARLVYWFHSIPKIHLDKWAANEAEEGKFLFANYIAYADASVSQQEQILAKIAKNKASTSISQNPEGLIQVVINAIKENLQTNQYIDYQYLINNMRFPVVIQSNGKTFIPVIDGNLCNDAAYNAAWNFAQIKQLQAQGLGVLMLWSEAWYRDWWGEKERVLREING